MRAAGALVLPGVGAFADGMAQLRALGLAEPLCAAARAGTPLLGICLGMQMLLQQSPEGGLTAGLGLIEGEVAPLPDRAADGSALKIPNVGWHALRLTPAAQSGPLRALAGRTRRKSILCTATTPCPPARRTAPPLSSLAGGKSARPCSAPT